MTKLCHDEFIVVVLAISSVYSIITQHVKKVKNLDYFPLSSERAFVRSGAVIDVVNAVDDTE